MSDKYINGGIRNGGGGGGEIIDKNEEMGGVVLGLDGGTTSTICVCMQFQGQLVDPLPILGRAVAGCSNHNSVGAERKKQESPAGTNGVRAEAKSSPVILQEHKDEVWFLQFSHIDKYLASSSKDHTTVVWEVKAVEREFDAEDEGAEVGEADPGLKLDIGGFCVNISTFQVIKTTTHSCVSRWRYFVEI